MGEDENIVLREAGIDVEGALERFCGNSGLYLKFLLKFPQDNNFSMLGKYVCEENNSEEGFRCAHTLKGVAGNLSLNELYQLLIPLVEDLRKCDMDSAKVRFEAVSQSYEKVIEAIGKI